MKGHAEFRLVPLDELREHERIEPEEVRALANRIQYRGVVDDPIWVAAGTGVILNGHHRVAALRLLGAHRAPAWVLEYESDAVRLERWSHGPPIAKAEVVRRAQAGELYSPKTTRHILDVELPHRPTPLTELMTPDGPGARASAQGRASGRSRAPRRGSAGAR